MAGRSGLRRPWFASIRVRIVAVVVLLLVVSSVGSVVLLRAVLFDRLAEEVEVSLDREAAEFRLLHDGIDPTTGEPFDDDLEAVFDVYFSREVPDEGETLLAFLDGELYEARRASGAADPGDVTEAIEYWLALDADEQGEIDTPLGPARYQALVYPDRDGATGHFVVANFPADEQAEIDDAVQTQISLQLVTLVIASLIGLALAGRVLRPLRRLADTAQQISDTDLNGRIPVTGRDEASQIAVTFNQMLSRLQQAFTAQRRFIDDTSHELRTPLTVIRGHVELLDLTDDPQERRATVATITDEVDRVTRIVNDLFLLARAEQHDFVTPEPTDLRSLVVDVHRKATVLAVREWLLTEPVEVVVDADRQRLTQALLQLCDNAVKYTAEGDRITVGGDVRQHEVLLWVDDSGTGVPEGDEQRVFERFTRGAEQPERVSGAGLGLSIVAAIAAAHGGRARLVRRPGPGSRFEIRMPASRAGAVQPGETRTADGRESDVSTSGRPSR